MTQTPPSGPNGPSPDGDNQNATQDSASEPWQTIPPAPWENGSANDASSSEGHTPPEPHAPPAPWENGSANDAAAPEGHAPPAPWGNDSLGEDSTSEGQSAGLPSDDPFGGVRFDDEGAAHGDEHPASTGDTSLNASADPPSGAAAPSGGTYPPGYDSGSSYSQAPHQSDNFAQALSGHDERAADEPTADDRDTEVAPYAAAWPPPSPYEQPSAAQADPYQAQQADSQPPAPEQSAAQPGSASDRPHDEFTAASGTDPSAAQEHQPGTSSAPPPPEPWNVDASHDGAPSPSHPEAYPGQDNAAAPQAWESQPTQDGATSSHAWESPPTHDGATSSHSWDSQPGHGGAPAPNQWSDPDGPNASSPAPPWNQHNPGAGSPGDGQHGSDPFSTRPRTGEHHITYAVPGGMGPNTGSTPAAATDDKPKSRKPLVWTALSVVVLLVAAAAVWFFVIRDDGSDKTADPEKTTTSESSESSESSGSESSGSSESSTSGESSTSQGNPGGELSSDAQSEVKAVYEGYNQQWEEATKSGDFTTVAQYAVDNAHPDFAPTAEQCLAAIQAKGATTGYRELTTVDISSAKPAPDWTPPGANKKPSGDVYTAKAEYFSGKGLVLNPQQIDVYFAIVDEKAVIFPECG